MLLRTERFLTTAVLVLGLPLLRAENPKEIVQQAVQTELKADRDDHSHWMFYEQDQEPKKSVKQWVAQAQALSLSRVLERNGQHLSEAQQKQELEQFARDTRAQTKQRKSGQHDDDQAAEMLRILPDAFIWNIVGEKGDQMILHFRPDQYFRAPNMEARVFGAMEGDMAVSMSQHRIVSLKGKLIRDVKIAGGLLGMLQAGGTFDVERRETGPGLWQITETHVHIRGHALIFHTISEDEDDVKSEFKQLPPTISVQQAEAELFSQGKQLAGK